MPLRLYFNPSNLNGSIPTTANCTPPTSHHKQTPTNDNQPMTSLTHSIAIVLLCISAPSAADLSPALRRPVALAPSADGNWLYVANRDSATLSIIDLKVSQVAAEHRLGQRLSNSSTLHRNAH